MSALSKDDSGQWLLLAAVIVAVGLAVLIVFVNQSVLAGHSSAGSIMDFPKNDIREFRAETMSEAYLLGVEANHAGTSLADRQSRFQAAFGAFVGDARTVYAYRGTDIKVSYVEGLNDSILPGGQRLDNVTMALYYNNGDTQYNETSVVYFE